MLVALPLVSKLRLHSIVTAAALVYRDVINIL